jgi:ribosome-binding protein aMBF1 (putative translation factor)
MTVADNTMLEALCLRRQYVATSLWILRLDDKTLPAMDIASRFGQNLVRARKRAKLSQEELAYHSALHRTEIGLLERGARIPRIDTLVKLAGALSIPPSELIEGIDWTPGNFTTGSFSVAPGGDPQSN